MSDVQNPFSEAAQVIVRDLHSQGFTVQVWWALYRYASGSGYWHAYLSTKMPDKSGVYKSKSWSGTSDFSADDALRNAMEAREKWIERSQPTPCDLCKRSYTSKNLKPMRVVVGKKTITSKLICQACEDQQYASTT